MSESSLRNEVIVNNKTFVDTRDYDSGWWHLWHRELEANNLMEWIETIVEVACLWQVSLAVDFDTGIECEIVALLVEVERHMSGE